MIRDGNGGVIIKSFVALSNDNNERAQSSSGGIFPLLAKEVLLIKGCVYAATYDEELNVCHIRISDAVDVRKAQGSKYVASDLDDTLINVENDLKKDTPVLFVGTPCQCAGLKGYLNARNCDCRNLFTVDFVCHGIPSKLVWNAYLEDIERLLGSKIASVNMRNKSTGWSRYSYSWALTDLDGKMHFQPQEENAYMKGFVNNLYLRPACYNCKFKGVERHSDITLADCWGVWDFMPAMDDNKGTSLLLVHTQTGEKLLNKVTDLMRCEELLFHNAIEYNPSIETSPSCGDARVLFFKQIYNGVSFDEAVHQLIPQRKPDTIAQKMKVKVKSLFRKNERC